MTELSNLCGLAQVRAVKKSCHAALVFSQSCFYLVDVHRAGASNSKNKVIQISVKNSAGFVLSWEIHSSGNAGNRCKYLQRFSELDELVETVLRSEM